jgi:hypothetical protein
MRTLPFLVLLAAAPAGATSFYSEADLGATIFVGSAGAYADPGPAFGARVGLGVTSWLDLGGLVSGSAHAANVPAPAVGQYFQLYHTGFDMRTTGRVGRVGLFAEGGGGWAFFSTNILDSVDVTKPYRHDGPYLAAGGGLEYSTENPRFAFGLGGDFALYPELGSLQTVSVRVYFRYTK